MTLEFLSLHTNEHKASSILRVLVEQCETKAARSPRTLMFVRMQTQEFEYISERDIFRVNVAVLNLVYGFVASV